MLLRVMISRLCLSALLLLLSCYLKKKNLRCEVGPERFSPVTYGHPLDVWVDVNEIYRNQYEKSICPSGWLILRWSAYLQEPSGPSGWSLSWFL